MTNKTLILAMVAAANMPAMSQNVSLSGTISDEAGLPMCFTNVILLSLPDSAFVQGTTSDENGAFGLAAKAHKGVLKVSSIGYETAYVNLKDFNGTITMKEDSRVLTEVDVRAQLPKTKLTGNSMVTSVEGTVLEKSGTAMEMLAKVPGMTSNGESLEVLGKGEPVFYINGRKMQDKDELKRMRSEDIKEVEVIMNPGAQYDATVSAVVRIKTVKREGNGFGFDVSANNDHALRENIADPNATINLRYRHKSVDFFGMLNYWKWDSMDDSEVTQESYVMQRSGLKVVSQENSISGHWKGQGFNENIGFNWQITDDHSVGCRIEHHDKYDSGQKGDMKTLLTERLPSGETISTRNDNKQKEDDKQPFNWEGNLYFNGKMGKVGIDLNVDFMTYKTGEYNHILDEENGLTSEMSSCNKSSNHMAADKLVLSYPLGSGMLQAGTEMSFVTRKAYYSIEGMELPSTETEVKETNVAGFVEYGCSSASMGNLSVGLRYEHVGFDYKDILDPSNDMTRYTDDIFPSLSWSKQMGKWQASLSYSFQTRRPNYWHLSEAVTYINSYTLQQGSAKLKNEKKQEFGANLRWGILNLSASYEHSKDYITQWSYINNDEGGVLLKHINMDTPVKKLSCFLTASPTWGVFCPNWSLGIQKYDVKVTVADPREATNQREVKYEKPFGIADLNNAIRLKKSWQMEANLSVMTKGDYTNFRFTNNTYRLNLVCQKSWLENDALTLRVALKDALQLSRQDIEMDCGYYFLTQQQEHAWHRLDVSMRYTFNATKSNYKGTGAGREAASRMK